MDLIININKPSGITSLQAVTKVKRIFGVRKAGHTGTLDPMATGVLLVCLGEATKVSRFLLDMDKKYRARVKLGERTDTCDAEGRVVERKDASSVTEDQLVNVVKMFEGEITQRPPMYSAVKVHGERLYKLARKGIEIDRPERRVRVYDLKVTAVQLPYFDMEVSCSKGTYIRTLCDDIGAVLGPGAHLFALERSAVGFFDIANAVSLGELGSDAFPTVCKKAFYSLDEALSELQEIVLEQNDYEKAKNGVATNSLNFSGLVAGSFVRLKGPSGQLFGIGRIDKGSVRVERILNL
ncbi:MAG: tRNA pseudouridine(55) synthase TruB [Acidobacteriota bacterium]